MPASNSLLSGLQIPRLMGIVNLTPDSFSDGARYLDPDRAVDHAERLIEAGAEIIDLGGESTRPGSTEVKPEIEIQRVLPVLERLHARFPETALSIDTRHALTARTAIAAGATIVNDISALRHDPDIAKVLADHPRVRIILMHMLGQPQTMQQSPHYEDVVQDILAFFKERIAWCETSGIAPERLMLDPGIGFGKSLQHNLKLLSSLSLFRGLGLPLVLGASRKRFIDGISVSPPDQRLGGSLAAALCGALQGVAVIRIHDVYEHNQFFKVLNAIKGAGL